jgi:hypothetical protein
MLGWGRTDNEPTGLMFSTDKKHVSVTLSNKFNDVKPKLLF